MMKFLVVLIAMLNSSPIEALLSCPNLNDYLTMNQETCVENPLEFSNITDIATSWGLEAKEFPYETSDGFQLNLYRINMQNQQSESVPILVAHGVGMNGESLMLNGNQSLVYTLVMAGYDVWLMNFRTTKYSSHLFIPKDNFKYWDHSLDDIIEEDVRLAVSLVQKATNQQMIYVGYGSGATVGLGFASRYPAKAQALKGIVALAPTTFSASVRGLNKYITPFVPTLLAFDKAVTKGRIMKKLKSRIERCNHDPDTMIFCTKTMGQIFGYNAEDITPEIFPLMFKKFMDGGSARDFDHMAQIGLTAEFKQYDYGPQNNIDQYASTVPPFYKLETIPVPVSIWLGKNDYLATVEDAMVLQYQLSEASRCDINLLQMERFDHLDWLVSKDAKKLYLDQLLEELKLLNQGTCSKQKIERTK